MTLPRTLARYELLEEIGRGNMGVVYKAKDPAIDRTVAIKVVRLGFAPGDKKRLEFLERFEREARIAGKLSHANIIAVHDVGLEDEPYLVMEHFSGVDLGSLIHAGPLHEDEVTRIVTELASALAYAHAQGVVHRDIKPANVLYAPGSGIKLVDFGIARLEVSELTATGEFIGTPSYMSPETFLGDRVDARADLFSVGVLLYQLLTGKRPFEAATVSRTIYRVLHEEPDPPTRLRPELNAGWDWVCARLLAKDPEARYPNAEALKDDLDALSEGRLLPPPGTAASAEPTLSLRAASRSRWKRAALLAAAAVGAVLYFSVVGSRSDADPERAASDSASGSRAGSLASGGQGPAPASDPVPSTTGAVPVPAPALESESVTAAPDPLSFVARHEHRIGHCTGDLTLGAREVRFVSSRHDWTWSNRTVRSFERRSASELELVVARQPDDGDTDGERFQFTFLRPEISRDRWEIYEARRP